VNPLIPPAKPEPEARPLRVVKAATPPDETPLEPAPPKDEDGAEKWGAEARGAAGRVAAARKVTRPVERAAARPPEKTLPRAWAPAAASAKIVHAVMIVFMV
jgi:hypothetical protein